MSERTVTLVRHAKSSWHFGALSDERRPLNRRGMRDCLGMQEVLRKSVNRPDLIITSDAVRTLQTCQAVADAFELYDDRVVVSHDVYLASYRALLKILRGTQPDVRHVLLIGHNPGISELCDYLFQASLGDLPTLAVVTGHTRRSNWGELGRSDLRMDKVLLPREVLKESKLSE